MALNRFHTQIERMRDLFVGESRAKQMEDVHLAIGQIFNCTGSAGRMVLSRARLERSLERA